MATPLGDLLRSVLTDDTARLAAGRSPSEFLQDHGWEHLDAADLREAMLVLADGAPTAEALVWVGGSDAIDPDADLADALTAATATFPAELVADDPAALDQIDGADDAPGPDDDSETEDVDDVTDHDDDRPTDGSDVDDTVLDDTVLDDTGDDRSADLHDEDVDTTGPADAPASGLVQLDAESFEADPLDEPEHFTEADDTGPDDAPAAGDFGDGWDDLI